MSRRRLSPVSLALALLLAALLVPACGGGGGGGGGGPTQPPPPAAGISYTPGSSAGGASVVLVEQSASGDLLTLRLEGRSFDDVYGLFFDLAYPSGVLSFEGASEGSFLSSGGAATAFEIAEQPGNLIVGLSRLGAAPGVSGNGDLLTLRFRGTAAGGGDLSFSRNQGVASDGDPLTLDWVGGSVTVSQ